MVKIKEHEENPYESGKNLGKNPGFRNQDYHLRSKPYTILCRNLVKTENPEKIWKKSGNRIKNLELKIIISYFRNKSYIL